MRKLINKLLESCNFVEKWSNNNNIYFYSNTVTENFIIINYIDVIDLHKSNIAEKFYELEVNYPKTQEKEGIKNIIKRTLSDEEKRKVDKNTSAIYVTRIKDNSFYENNNLIYDIEESPYFFKRYILAYTDSQFQDLNIKIEEKYKELINYRNNLLGYDKRITITECLSRLLENNKEYYDLLNDENDLGYYALLIRFFSKLPFLVYDSNPISMTFSLEKNIQNRINNSMKCEQIQKLHDYINNVSPDRIEDFLDNEEKIEKIINIENNIDTDEIEAEITKLLEDARNGL